MKPEQTIYLAEFEEYYGKSKISIEIYENLLENQGKGHLESLVSYANLFKRQKDLKNCLNVLEKYKSDFKKEFLPYIIILQSSYLSTEEARELFKQNLKNFFHIQKFFGFHI